MNVVAKMFEAVGIACVMIGLVHGIQADDMWIELYLSITGIALFLVGWGFERWVERRRRIRKGRQSGEAH